MDRRKENSQEVVLNKLLAQPGNDICADCQTRSPRWASVTIGVFLCIRCAGIHRQIGVHVTLVKSVNLDTWKPEHIQKLTNVGNLKAAQIYEATAPASARPNPNDQYAVEQWIRAKYERKLFVGAGGVPATPAPSPAAPTSPAAAAPTSRRSRPSAPAATFAAPHSAPVHRRSSSTATTTATPAPAPAPAPTVDLFSFDFTPAAAAPVPAPAPGLAAVHAHHQRTPSSPASLHSYSVPSVPLFSTMSAPTSPAVGGLVTSAHSPPQPATAASMPADLFAGLSLGSTASPSPLPTSAAEPRSYDSAKADIMQLFSSTPSAAGMQMAPAGAYGWGQPTPALHGAATGALPMQSPYVYQQQFAPPMGYATAPAQYYTGFQ